MKITLYNAITADGFIARKDGDSDWVSEVDYPSFEKAITDAGCIILGRKTFEQFENDLYPFPGVKNVVLTRNKDKVRTEDNLLISNLNPEDVVKLLESQGHSKALLVGGGLLNGAFLKLGLIDEVILSIHPLFFGSGIKLFEDVAINAKLKKVSSIDLEEGLIQVLYKVIK